MEISSRSRSSSGSGNPTTSPFAPFMVRSPKPEPEFASALRDGREHAQAQLDAMPAEHVAYASPQKDTPLGTTTRAMKRLALQADKAVDRAREPEVREKSSADESGKSSGREPTTARSQSESQDDVWPTSKTTSKSRKPKWISRSHEKTDAALPKLPPNTSTPRSTTPTSTLSTEMANTAEIAGVCALDHTDAVVQDVGAWLDKHPSATKRQIFERILTALIGGLDRQKIKAVVADLPSDYCRTVALPHVALNERLGIKYDESDLIDRSSWTENEKGKAAYKKSAIADIHGSIVGGPLCAAIKRRMVFQPKVLKVVDTIEATMNGRVPGETAAKVDEKTRNKWHAAFITFASLVIARGTDLCKD